MVASLEEETLHVVGRLVVNAEHGEELAVGDRLALFLARNLSQENLSDYSILLTTGNCNDTT